ncbi:response regulator [Rhodalgimonas zhirmunskyi]|uniref:Response regulator n=1 Tax=Rhodalgimonas zhirmunskyi TaxID=2964767 RepID=A0AAJ1X6M7_9RHOB|nr:response regulator [Rhodoalgimonas zhirmunskyi]MDQ2095661.1 response regulator [Rhodoalgimonas zhirmunskyi]
MDDLDLNPHRSPTAARPLLGLTILVVEDSRFACEAMRLLCLRSGARIRRADCLASARRHLQVYRPSAVVIDLGLPDGSGTDLITELANTSPRIGVIIGTSGDDGARGRAMQAGADGFLDKPITRLAEFQEVILANLPIDRQPNGPRQINDDEVKPDPIAYRDDMAHAADLLGDDVDGQHLDYLAQFVSGVARSAQDDQLADAAGVLARSRNEGRPSRAEVARLAGLVHDRLAERLAI